MLALGLLASGAEAVTTCRILSGGGLNFGNYDTLAAAPNDSLATVLVQCTREGGPQNVTVTLQLNQGIHGASVQARRMANNAPAGGYLNYGLYRDVGRSMVWGFNTGVDTEVRSLSIPNKDSRQATFTIYGRIPAQQDSPVGSYSDRVTATVTP